MFQLPLARAWATAAFCAALSAVVWLDRVDLPSRPTHSAAGVALRFRQAAAESGVAFHHQPFDADAAIANIESHVSGLGASVSIVDFDCDGKLDLYATSSKAGTRNALFHNRGDGRFDDVAPERGIADLNRDGEGHSMGSIWADLDGDFDRDCLVYRFGRPKLMRNDGTRFTDVTADAGLDVWINSPAACFFDYDRDGRLDLYLAAYFREEIDLTRLASTEIMQDSFEFSKNGGRDRVFHNEGALRFKDVTAAMGCDVNTRWTLAVAALDIDGDGWQDLYLANDYGPEEMYRNVRGERFELADVGLSDRSKSGMCVAVGDVRNTGRPSFFVTNISRPPYLNQGNNLRLNTLAEKNRFENIAEERGVVDCGWAWGAQFGDLDNDGWVDLFVVNGFLSQSRERDYWYDMSKIASGAAFFSDAAHWPAIEDKTLSGYEPSRVFLNVRGETFRDVARHSGVDDLFDGRGVALGDLFDRGVLDAVVANHAGPLLIYRNETPPEGRNWLRIELRGQPPNRDAIGACVQLEVGAEKRCQFVLAGSGFAAQNDLRLHFGLGAIDRAPRATVRWPSGRVQLVDLLKVNATNVIEEPAP